jgi:hypothetical protein
MARRVGSPGDLPAPECVPRHEPKGVERAGRAPSTV